MVVRRTPSGSAGVLVAGTSMVMMVGLLAAPPATAAPAKKALTDRVSVRTGGFEGHAVVNSGGQSGNERRLLSANGRFSVFESASELIGKNNLTSWGVYVRDRKLGTTTRVSVSSSGKAANANSGSPSISANGRYISFSSAASNLVPGDTNGTSDVFVHDRKTRTTSRVSVDSAGKQHGAAYRSGTASLSPNGRFVTFQSDAPGLAPGTGKACRRIFTTGTPARQNW